MLAEGRGTRPSGDGSEVAAVGASRTLALWGFLFAVASAASFALSGIFASALLSAGWSAGAAATARIVLAALILAAPTAIALRGRWHLVRAAWRPILLFGLLAVVGAQLAFFLAVQFILPSLALLIEFTGPVLLMLWTWLRTRVAPSVVTLLGAALALLGLAVISGVVTGDGLHPLGIAFALVAAIGVAAYYATGAMGDHGIPPLPFVGLGLAVGAVVLILVSATGMLPFVITDAPAVVAGVVASPWLLVTGMVLISTVLSYVLGVAASRRLGATVASFTGYSEPLFGVLWTAVLLSVLPTPLQWLGAALIVAGVVTVKAGELLRARRRIAAR
ncbi:MAG: DMT family transporter [Candidatus Leucobacter sulfamidivorax]|nr:DMT family transporter [Candidatus Leucobacter sulfamidivorax]